MGGVEGTRGMTIGGGVIGMKGMIGIRAIYVGKKLKECERVL